MRVRAGGSAPWLSHLVHYVSELLTAADVPVQVKVYEGMIHAFFTATHKIDTALEAQRFAAATLKQALYGAASKP